MAEHGAPNLPPSRAELEKLMAADLRAMTARSDRVGRYFARQHDLHSSDLQALLHIMVAETAGEPLNSTQLRERMDISNAAITYLVDRVMSDESRCCGWRATPWRSAESFLARSVLICAPRSPVCPTMTCGPPTGY
jgi:hypothetical protein